MEKGDILKCIRCGKSAEIVRKVYMDGAIKEIGYCKDCFREMLKYESMKYVRAGVYTLTSHMELVEESKMMDNKFHNSIENIYSEQPSIVQLTLFANDRYTYKKTLLDIQKRELTFLKYKLRNALKAEDYRKASKLKQRIDELMKTLRETPQQ